MMHTFWTSVPEPVVGAVVLQAVRGAQGKTTTTGNALCSPCTCMHLLRCLAAFDLQVAHVNVNPAPTQDHSGHVVLQQ